MLTKKVKNEGEHACSLPENQKSQTDRWADLFEAKLHIRFNNEYLAEDGGGGRGTAGGRRWRLGRVWPLNIASAAVAESGKKWKTATSAAASAAAAFTHLLGYFVLCRCMAERHHNKVLNTLELN